MSNIVAIVGRPNVGKSTLFNRLTESRNAIVDETAGVTRDRHYGHSIWNGVEFSVIDTGGLVTGSDDIFEEEIRKQVNLAIDEASVILFLLDVEEGLTGMDEEVAQLLRLSRKPVFVVANKADNPARVQLAGQFYALGLGEVYPISSINGSGTGELLDALVEKLDKEARPDEFEGLPKLAVVGRPNVGKSSFINALIGEERNIVTPIAGTTRDSILTRYSKFGFDFVIVDTAGIRRKSRVKEDIEFYSVLRSIRSIENADVCLVMLDATLGMEAQDLNIFRLAQKNHKGVVVLVNKWDLADKDNNAASRYEQAIKERLKPFDDVPVLFTSIPKMQRIHKALETAMEVYKNRSQKIPTSKLNDVLLPIIENNPPPARKGKYIKIKYITQLPVHYPSFAVFCNLPQYIDETYKRFLENKLRQNFNLRGVPVEIYFRKK